MRPHELSVQPVPALSHQHHAEVLLMLKENLLSPSWCPWSLVPAPGTIPSVPPCRY